MVDRIKLTGTDLEVSKICLGMMSYGSPSWQPWVSDIDQSVAVINQAIDEGINFFDTADLYSDGESERILGKVMKDPGLRSRCVIATKVGYPTTEVGGSGFSHRRIQAALDASLRRLNTDYIDLYQLHAWDPDTDIQSTLELLEKLQVSGKIRHFGICNFTFSQLQTALRHSPSVATFQGQYNLLYRGIERRVVPLLLSTELPLLAYSPLARGYLASSLSVAHHDTGNALRLENDPKGRSLYEKSPKSNLLKRLEGISTGRGVSNSTTAISWVLSKSAVSSVIFGAADISQLSDALRATSLKLTASEIELLEEDYRDRPIDLQDVNNTAIVDEI